MVDLATERPYLQNVAYCYEELQLFDQAERCYELILEHDASKTDVRLHLANMFDIAGMPKRASDQFVKFGQLDTERHQPLVSPKHHLENSPGPTLEVQVPSSSHLTLSTIRKTSRRKAPKPTQPKESLASLHDLDESWLQMKLAKECLRQDPSLSWNGWMINAKIVTDNFRSQPSFFPSERNTRFSGYRNETGKSSLSTGAAWQRQDDDLEAQNLGS